MVAVGAEVSLKARPSDGHRLAFRLSLLFLAQPLTRVGANHLEQPEPLRSVRSGPHQEALLDQALELLARGVAHRPGPLPPSNASRKDGQLQKNAPLGKGSGRRSCGRVPHEGWGDRGRWGTRCPRAVRSDRLSSSRASTASGEKARKQAAASSIVSGRLSSLRQISVTVASFSAC